MKCMLSAKLVLVILAYVWSAARSAGAASSGSDEASLKEALVLVDILKSEYIRALRENVAGMDEAEQEGPTCAPTEAGPKTDINETENVSQKPLRRMMSPDFPDNYVKNNRRFDDEDPFNGNPPNSTTTDTTPTTESKADSTPNLSSSVSTNADTTTESSTTKPPNKNTLQTDSDRQTQITDSDKMKLKVTVKDPESAEVAAELANEIQHVDVNTKSKKGKISSKKKKAKISTITSSIYTKSIVKKDLLQRFLKTTRKIHLERSTRYPIPLPENHAFCFTNPNNALCRTQI